MKIEITPPVANLSAVTLEVLDPGWTPNVGISFEYRLLNSDGEICSPRKRIMFDGDAYASWGEGDDEDIIIRSLAKKLGLEIVEPEVVPEVEEDVDEEVVPEVVTDKVTAKE